MKVILNRQQIEEAIRALYVLHHVEVADALGGLLTGKYDALGCDAKLPRPSRLDARVQAIKDGTITEGPALLARLLPKV